MDREKLQKLQIECHNLKELFKITNKDNKEDMHTRYFIDNGILMRSWKEPNSLPSAVNKIVVPKILRNEILRLGHQSALPVYLGIHKTFDRISNIFFWPGINVAVKTFVRSYNNCQKLGKGKILKPAPLINLPILNEPSERLGNDIIVPLNECKDSGNRFIFSVIDLCIHHPISITLKRHTAVNIADAL